MKFPRKKLALQKKFHSSPLNALTKSATNKKQPFKIPMKSGVSPLGKSALTSVAKRFTIAEISSLWR